MHGGLSVSLVALAVAAALLSLVSSPALAFSLTEVLHVKGCRDSNPPHSTTGCFAGSKAIRSVDLSIRGLNFPQPPRDDAGEQFADFQVELVESLPLSALEGEDVHATVPHLQLSCEDVRQSEVFPSQLLTCVLRNPVAVPADVNVQEREAAQAGEEALTAWEAAGGSAWFDVVIRVLATDEHGDTTYQDLCILRRSVQVDVRALLRKMGRAVKGSSSSADAARPYNVSTHPLERLYASKPAAHRGAEKAAAESGIPEADEEDYLWVELGIGGLKKELRELFRRVFLSRLPSLANLTETLDIQHVRGVILYGPPGNGKSLIARSLFKLLGPDTRLTVVNAADVLSKFVGESEKNLRDVFGGNPIGMSSRAEDARKDGTEPVSFSEDDDDGNSSTYAGAKQLHVLVIDEFESLFRRRGHSEDESSAKAVYDGVTNTLLSLMDGIESRNDLLVVGLTNRLQSIDSAMLRPGRFEVLIEVPSPDVPAREEIFFIHTAKLREEGFLADDVSLHDLAVRSGGFSGSDIAGTVRSATSYALLRYRQEAAEREGSDHGARAEAAKQNASTSACAAAATAESHMPTCDGGGADDAPRRFEVTTEDLHRAMADIRSAKDETSSLTYLSEQDDELSTAVDYDGAMGYRTTAVARLVRQVSKSRRVFTGVVGISGAAGTGKSFLARQLTTVHAFDTVRFLSGRRLVELRDRNEQLEQVRDALGEASRVRSGLVVLDDFDVLYDSFSGFPIHEATLRNMLYEYRNRPRGVSRSLQGTKDSAREASEAGGGGVTVNAGSSLHDARNRRFLVLTSSRQDALSMAEPDVRLRVRPIHRAGLVELLAHFNISSVANTQQWRLTVNYPPTISFRNFLRVTDRALWMAEAASGENGADKPSFFSGSIVNPFVSVTASDAAGQGRYLLTTQAQATAFSSSVKSVTAAMSLTDSFTGWYNRLPRTDLYEEVPKEVGQTDSDDGAAAEDESASGATTPQTIDEADEAAADVGVEAMW